MLTHQQKTDLMATKYDRKNPRDLSKFTKEERRLVAEHLRTCKECTEKIRVFLQNFERHTSRERNK